MITTGTTKVSGDGVDPFDVDLISLGQIVDAINATPIGVKSRITHPELDGVDDLTCRLGYVRNARLVGNSVRADMFFHAPTDPDALRIMGIAEVDPGSCGLSIKSETATIEPLETTPTGLVLRVDTLDAVDWVGEPAANPAGMLSATRRHRRRQITLGAPTMNEKQMDFLRQVGLPFDATPEQTAAFIEALTDEQKDQLAAMKEDPKVEDAVEDAVKDAVGEATNAAAGDSDGTNLNEDDDAKKAVAASAARKKAAAASAAGQPQVSNQAQIQAAVRQAGRDERTRSTEIRQIALNLGYGEDWIQKHIDAETEIGDVRKVALANLKREPGHMVTTQITAGSDLNRDNLEEAVQDGIMLRASSGRHRFVEFDDTGGVALAAGGAPKVRAAHARADQFRGHNVIEIGRRYLIALGYHPADRMSRPALGKLLMDRAGLQAALPGTYLAHGTGDFPFILADAMGKVLRAAYALAPSTWQLWCNRTTAPDFKDIKKLQLSEAADLVLIPEGDDYTFGTLTESREVYALSTYGKGINLTRKALINDDLSAFDRIPRQLGQAASRQVEGLAVAIPTANAVLADGIALFATGHANLTTGTLSVTSLGAGRGAMRKQTALGSSDPLEIMPRYLLVPEALFVIGSQLVSSAVDPALSNATPNPFANQLQVISSPRLDTDSAVQWYLAADPGQVDTIDVCFLEGQEAPMIEEENEFDTGNRRIKVTQDAVAKAIDFRGLTRSSGA